MTAGAGIAYVAFHRWSDLHRRSRSLACALARCDGVDRVVYVNPGVDLMGLIENPAREWRGPDGPSWKTVRGTSAPEGPIVTTPMRWIPFARRIGALGRASTGGMARKIERLAGPGFRLISNAVSADAEDLVLRLAEGRPFLFDWTDDFTQFASFRDDPERLRRLDDRIGRYLSAAGRVAAVNEHIAGIGRRAGAEVAVVPNGADLAGMSRAWREDLPCPEPLRSLGDAPVLGYSGVLTSTRFDADLLEKAMDRLEGWTFVAVGDHEPGLAKRLSARPDVRLLPPVPQTELAAWYRRFDVCSIPHLDNPHTRGNDPLKIYEYLAAGRPVVSTGISGSAAFPEHVAVEEAAEGFARAVHEARRTDSPDLSAGRARAVESHSWDSRAATILNLLSSL